MKKASMFIRISGQIDSRGLYECVKQMGMNVTDLGDMTLVYGDCSIDDVMELVCICWSYGDITAEINHEPLKGS